MEFYKYIWFYKFISISLVILRLALDVGSLDTAEHEGV